MDLSATVNFEMLPRCAKGLCSEIPRPSALKEVSDLGLKPKGVPSVVPELGVLLNPDVADASRPEEVATEEEEERNSSEGLSKGDKLRCPGGYCA